MGRVAVRDLGDVADARLLEMSEKGGEEPPSRFPLRSRIAAADAEPGLDEGTDEPRPDGPLMVRAVALADSSLVARAVPGLPGRERAQAQRGQEARLHAVDDRPRALALEERLGKAADRQ